MKAYAMNEASPLECEYDRRWEPSTVSQSRAGVEAERTGKVSAVAKVAACGIATGLVAVMAPVLAEGLDASELISAAGLPSVIGAIIADGAVLLLMAMAGVALLGAMRSLGSVFGLPADLSALDAPAFCLAKRVLGLAGAGFAGAATLLAGVNILFSAMVEHGLNATLSAGLFLGVAVACAVALALFWLVMGLLGRSLGGFLGFFQRSAQSGSIGFLLELFLSIALAPLVVALIIAGVFAASSIALTVAWVMIGGFLLIKFGPLIFTLCLAACRD